MNFATFIVLAIVAACAIALGGLALKRRASRGCSSSQGNIPAHCAKMKGDTSSDAIPGNIGCAGCLGCMNCHELSQCEGGNSK